MEVGIDKKNSETRNDGSYYSEKIPTLALKGHCHQKIRAQFCHVRF